MENGRRGKDLRIGDPERENAMRLLGEHFSAGRLDVQEYDERCQQAAAARFGSELDALFEDLPAPRPSNPPRSVVPEALPAMRRAARGNLVVVICAAVLIIFLIVAARQLALVLLVPLAAMIWFYWRR
ncbi:DUF1707 SHOCT-like domain-containing protein [Saccharopolyspora phatthalungensis]|uniref:DUF1707 domain-containing protein n=1 Tax=Saccharopolyspora phatthalungensis TaxID=664693 RepID=A0A840Q560_9PSEU|nr:DUF1707 domain-containing protein [Saccharopolyspora phatthalungensis]MBB5155107.1 hypothetical protein [Saccharopolyspora phatthalungensis]